MALDFQNIPLVFAQGLDTKSDGKAVPLGKFSELENAVFTKTGILTKRFGYDILPTTIQGGLTSVSAARALATFEDELILFSGKRAYTWAPGVMAWQDRGAVVSLATRAFPVLHNSYTQSNPDSAVNHGVRVTAWEDSRTSNTVRCSIQDAETGAFFASDILVGTGAQPRVVAFGSDVVIFYTNSNNLLYRLVRRTAPTAVSVTEYNPVATLVSGAPSYDALVVADRLFVAWNDSGSSTGKLAYLDATYTLSSTVNHTIAATNAIGLFSYSASSSVVVICANATDVKAKAWTYSLTASSGTATIATVSHVSRVCGIFPEGSSLVSIWYERYESSPTADHRIVSKASLNPTTGAVTAGGDVRGVGLAARFMEYDGVGYALIARQSEFQSTYFLADTSGNIVARVSPGNGGGLRTKQALPGWTAVSAGVFDVATLTTGRLIGESGELFSLPGPTVQRFDFASQAYARARVGNNLIVGGGVVRAYDGVSFSESGFHLFPERLSVDQTGFTITVTHEGDAGSAEVTTFACPAGIRLTGGQYFTLHDAVDAPYYCWITVDGAGSDPAPGGTGLGPAAILSTDTAAQVATKIAAILDADAAFIAPAPGAATITNTNAANGACTNAANGAAALGIAAGSLSGTYEYAGMYERTDNFGQIVRSAASVPLQVIAAAGSSATITIQTLRLTSSATPTRLVLYRTLAGGAEVFYRLGSIALPTLNSTSVDSIQILDTASDASIQSNEILYTVGGVLDATAPPASSLVVSYRNRIFLAGHSDPLLLSYSTITRNGEAVYFNGQLTIRLDPRGGDITALGVLDDKLVVFKETAIFVLAGDGPENTGLNSDYQDPLLIATDVGCSSAASVVQTANGLVFQSPKGLYLLDRSLQVSYQGAPVEAYNATQVTGAAMVPNTNQVRYVSATGPARVYDYLYDQWSTFTNHDAVDCDVWQGEFVFAKSDGRVFVENRTKWTDGGDHYVRLRGVTAWVATAGILGFQRVSRVAILGDYRGPHKLLMKLGFNYAPEYLQEKPFDATATIPGPVYGAAPFYGSGIYGGGPTVPEEFQMRVERQMCTAFRVSFEDVQSSEYNEGMAVNGITLLVGQKRGLNKIPATRRA
jgi:hypothetical protein